MWVFVLTIGLSFITGLNEAEESRNEDLDIKKKKKIKVYKESDCSSTRNEALRELQVIDIFY